MFHAEVRRVLAPGGWIAVWTYSLPTIGPALDGALRHSHSEVVESCWPPERRHVETGYRTIPFPFDEIEFPGLEIRARLTLAGLLGYVGTWSATTAFGARYGEDPLVSLRQDLSRHRGDPESPRVVTWPLTVRAGRPGERQG